jgi:hypothetical protein
MTIPIDEFFDHCAVQSKNFWLVKGDWYDWDEAEQIAAATDECAALKFCEKNHLEDDSGGMPGFSDSRTYDVRHVKTGQETKVRIRCDLQPWFTVERDV